MVTLQVAFALPSADVAVIVVVPGATAVMAPSDTVATEGLLDIQVTDCMGVVVAVSSDIPPMYEDKRFLLSFTVVLRTVTLQVAVPLPSALVAVIVVVPAPTLVTTPLATVATEGLPDTQVTV